MGAIQENALKIVNWIDRARKLGAELVVFPEMTIQLMATGEEAGELDTMLIKSSDFFDRQVEATVAGISALIEPVMIVLVGGMIGFIKGRGAD